MGVVTADAWSPGIYPWDYGQKPVLQWLAMAKADRLARDNLLVNSLPVHFAKLHNHYRRTANRKTNLNAWSRALPIHGDPTNSRELYDTIGYEYRNFTTTDFMPGGLWC